VSEMRYLIVADVVVSVVMSFRRMQRQSYRTFVR
jgi:hypothetical protein